MAAATLPVAATSSVTSPVVAALVRYWVAAAAFGGEAAHGVDRRADADGAEHDHREDLELHAVPFRALAQGWPPEQGGCRAHSAPGV